MNNILIVEENSKSRDHLVNLLNDNFKGIKIFQSATGKKALQILKTNKIDLFFLDTQLPDVTGLQIAEKIRSIQRYELAYIIFISSHTLYIQTALHEYHCYDYIKKPYCKDRIINLTNKLLKGLNKNNTSVEIEKFITVELKDIIYRININDIYFGQTSNRTLLLHTAGEGTIKIPNMTSEKMFNRIEKSGVDYIIKTHRSYFVNVNYVKDIKKYRKKAWDISFYSFEGVALIGRNYKEGVLSRLVTKGCFV